MNNPREWVLRHVDCEACGGTHDLYFDEEPVIHRDIIFTCPVTLTGTRLRELHTPEPADEHAPGEVFAHAT
jgi:hypothetical protein